MTHFTPTPAERRKYAAYTVEFRETPRSVSVSVQDGVVYRWTHLVRRVPSTKTFIVYVSQGVTAAERSGGERSLLRLPAGEWARLEPWSRRRAKNGQVFFQQMRGVPAPDPFAQLELELMIDATTDHRQEAPWSTHGSQSAT